MPDRHKTKPKAVRMPDGLLARVGPVLIGGESVNAFIVAAIEAELERREGGSTASGSTTFPPRLIPGEEVAPRPARRKPRQPEAAPAARKSEPAPPRTSHALTCKCGICRPPKESKR